MNRIDRLMSLITTMQSKKVTPLSLLSEKFQVSERTIYRDLKSLIEMGVPIEHETDKGYRILEGFFLPPLSLTLDEANALILTAALAEKFSDQSTQKLVDQAMVKIKSVLHGKDKSVVDQWQSQISIYRSPMDVPPGDYLTSIQKAISGDWILKMNYTNNLLITSDREVEPIGLTFYTNQWHMIAWCWNRKAYRDFKVKNINQLYLTSSSFRKSDHLDLNGYILSLSQSPLT